MTKKRQRKYKFANLTHDNIMKRLVDLKVKNEKILMDISKRSPENLGLNA